MNEGRGVVLVILFCCLVLFPMFVWGVLKFVDKRWRKQGVPPDMP